MQKNQHTSSTLQDLHLDMCNINFPDSSAANWNISHNQSNITT